MGWWLGSGLACGLLLLACGETSRSGALPMTSGGGAGAAAHGVTSEPDVGGGRSAETGGSSGKPPVSTPASVGGAGGASDRGGSSSGADGGEGGGAGASGGPCPVWPAKSTAAPAELRLNGVTIRSSEHDCAWSIGNPVKLPVSSDHTRMLFHYDVNGDGIDDVFAGPSPYDFPNPLDPTDHGTVTLLLSKVEGGELSFEPTDCTLAPPLVDGIYALRDLDGDGVTDFVLTVSNGIRVIMNRPSGPELTVAYDFPDTTQSNLYLGDVVLGQFEQDSTTELAVGFARIYDSYANTQAGTLLFHDPTSASAQAPTPLAISDQAGNGFDIALDPELGIFTATQGGRGLYGGSGEYTWLYEAGQRATKLRVGGQYLGGPSYLGSLTTGGRDFVFAGLGDSAFVFEAHDQEHATEIPMAFGHPLPFGRAGSSYLLLDADGDGDLDLLEGQADAIDTPSLVLYNGDADRGLSSQGQLFTPAKYRAPNADSPFLAVGAAKGRLLVSNAVYRDARFPLSVSPIGCGP